MRRIAAAALLFLALVVQASAVTYTISDLGSLAGMTKMRPEAISDTGYIPGYWQSGAEASSGFVWHAGTLTDASIPGEVYAMLTGINDLGQAVGWSDIMYPAPGWGSHGFTWENGVVTPLPTLGGRDCRPTDINNSGQITGTSQTADGYERGFIYDGEVMTNIDPDDGWTGSNPRAINENGEIAGYWHTELYGQHGFIWRDGVATDLHVEYSQFSEVTDLNDLGWAVGRADDYAVLWRNGNSEFLGSLGVSSFALGVNNPGQIVGSYQTYNDLLRAFIWQDGSMSDLNSMVTPNSGWVLEEASAVNNLGQIVGAGTLNGQYRGFLLTPVPEPSGMLALAVGLLGIIGVIRKTNRRQ